MLNAFALALQIDEQRITVLSQVCGFASGSVVVTIQGDTDGSLAHQLSNDINAHVSVLPVDVAAATAVRTPSSTVASTTAPVTRSSSTKGYIIAAIIVGIVLAVLVLLVLLFLILLVRSRQSVVFTRSNANPSGYTEMNDEQRVG